MSAELPRRVASSPALASVCLETIIQIISTPPHAGLRFNSPKSDKMATLKESQQ